MGEIIEFRPRGRRPVAIATASATDIAAIETAASTGDRAAVLAAADPLLRTLARDFGFTVMRNGLPRDATALAAALLGLARAVARLADEFGVSRRLGAFGVYFGRDRLAWFEDGYGEETALAVPAGVDPADLAAFVRQRLVSRRRGA